MPSRWSVESPNMRMRIRHVAFVGSMLGVLSVADAAGNPASSAATECMNNMRRDLARTELRMRNQLKQSADQAAMVMEFMSAFDPSDEDLQSLWSAAMGSIDDKLADCQERLGNKADGYMTRLGRRHAGTRMMQRAAALSDRLVSGLDVRGEELKDEFEDRMRELYPDCDVESFDDDSEGDDDPTQ